MADIPFTLDDWNEILGRINDVAANPAPGCNALDPLPLVTAPHIWTTTDVEAARDKLLAICPDNTFTANDQGVWKGDILDELRTAISNDWCNCEEMPCEDVTVSVGGPTNVFDRYSYEGMVFGSECNVGSWPVKRGYITHVAAAINGYQLFPPIPYPPGWPYYPIPVRTYEYYRVYLPLSLEGCPPHTLPDYGIGAGLVNQDGTVGSPYGGGDDDILIGWGDLLLEYKSGYEDDDPYVGWPVDYELRGYCSMVGLDNFRIARQSPPGTLVGHITCSNSLFSASLYPSWDFEQVGDEVRTRVGFYDAQDVVFMLNVSGPGLYQWSEVFVVQVR